MTKQRYGGIRKEDTTRLWTPFAIFTNHSWRWEYFVTFLLTNCLIKIISISTSIMASKENYLHVYSPLCPFQYVVMLSIYPMKNKRQANILYLYGKKRIDSLSPVQTQQSTSAKRNAKLPRLNRWTTMEKNKKISNSTNYKLNDELYWQQ